ncbi:MAG TPA: chloride channel protein [Thermoplasmataceae archaeon]|nr:chloride channel protein [Thermoplasmataceae archaeon]
MRRTASQLLESLSYTVRKGNISKWLIVGVLIGVVAGLGSLALYFMIRYATEFILTGITGFVPPSSGFSGGMPYYSIGSFRRLLIPVSTVAGGLISGFIVYRFAPEAEGHGTDAAIRAFHFGNGRIRRRIPLVKMVASAITIGSGGSAGREGPTAQIAAGFGSYVADAFKMSDHDRRIAMAAGIGAGIGSIFMAPLGGALLSTEILYRQDFEVEALIPSIIASIVGYSIFGYAFGYRPIFTIPSNVFIGFVHPLSLAVYALVGVLAGLSGILYVKIFYGVHRLFLRIRVSRYFKPAIGAAVTGLIGMEFPQILGLGYGWVQLIFFQNLELLPLWILIALFFLKIIATSFTISSGGSGGVFAPGLGIGAFLGASIGILVHPYFPQLNIVEVTIVSMIAFFGGISKAPISVLIMGTEMTGGYGLFLPLMLATTISYFVSGSKYSIYSAQVRDRSQSPAHAIEYMKPVMDNVKVADAVKIDYPRAGPDMTLREAYEELRSSRTKTVVVEQDGKPIGLLSPENFRQDLDWSATKVTEVMSRDLPLIDKEKSIHEALDLLVKTPIGKLVVIDRENGGRIVGTIGFSEVADAYNREIRRIKLSLSEGGQS